MTNVPRRRCRKETCRDMQSVLKTVNWYKHVNVNEDFHSSQVINANVVQFLYLVSQSQTNVTNCDKTAGSKNFGNFCIIHVVSQNRTSVCLQKQTQFLKTDLSMQGTTCIPSTKDIFTCWFCDQKDETLKCAQSENLENLRLCQLCSLTWNCVPS